VLGTGTSGPAQDVDRTVDNVSVLRGQSWPDSAASWHSAVHFLVMHTPAAVQHQPWPAVTLVVHTFHRTECDCQEML